MASSKGFWLVLLIVTCQLQSASEAARLTKVDPKEKPDKERSQNRKRSVGDDEADEIVKTSVDNHGQTHTRLRETFKGLPIRGADKVEHRTRDGTVRVTGFTAKGVGESLRNTDLSTAALDSTANERKAKALARKIFFKGVSSRQIEIVNTLVKTFIYIRQSDGEALPAHRVKFFMESPTNMAEPVFLMNAKTGEVLEGPWDEQRQRVSSSDIPKTIGTGPGGNARAGCHRYDDDGFGKMRVTENAGVCSLKNEYVQVHHCQNRNNWGTVKCRRYTTPFTFPCAESNSDATNGGCSPMNDALFFATKFLDFLKERYNGYQPFNKQVVILAHFKRRKNNAIFFCGEDVPLLFLGDGAYTSHPLTCADTLGHELAHGVTCEESNLEYRNISGGADEAFSDMSGKVLEAYIYGEIQNGWTVGLGCEKRGREVKRDVRHMDNPTADGYSINHAGKYYAAMDPHYSSGVLNHVFYLLATSPGWDIFKAYDVFLGANKDYWVSLDGFKEQAEGVLWSAEDLGYPLQHVIKAFKKVGITVG